MSGAGMMMGARFAPLAVSVSPAIASGSSTSSTVTTGAVTLTITGGSGLVDIAWGRISGSAAIEAVSPTLATTPFQATGMSVGSLSAVFGVTVTDRVTGEVRSPTSNVNVYVERGYPELSVSGPADILVDGASSAEITVSGSTGVSISGGVPPYTTTWSKSGDFVIAPSGVSCGASRALGPGGGVLGTLYVKVVDSIGQEVNRSCTVMLRNVAAAPPPLEVSVSPASVTGMGTSLEVIAGPVTLTVTGAVGAVHVQWSLTSGVGEARSPNALTTDFRAGVPWSESAGGYFQALVWDDGGRSKAVSVAAVFYNFGTGGGPIN